MKVLPLLITCLLVTSCQRQAETSSQTSNPEVKVETLFRHDGCTVYRFRDGGNDHYYVRCSDGYVRADTSISESCGKACTRTRVEGIETKEQN